MVFRLLQYERVVKFGDCKADAAFHVDGENVCGVGFCPRSLVVVVCSEVWRGKPLSLSMQSKFKY